MKEVYSHADSMRVGHAQSLLEAEGIICFVQNDLSHNLIGGSIVGPLKLFDPVLCVSDESDFERAKEIIDSWAAHTGIPASSEAEWKCPGCGEMVPEGFTSCWSCERERSAADL